MLIGELVLPGYTARQKVRSLILQAGRTSRKRTQTCLTSNMKAEKTHKTKHQLCPCQGHKNVRDMPTERDQIIQICKMNQNKLKLVNLLNISSVNVTEVWPLPGSSEVIAPLPALMSVGPPSVGVWLLFIIHILIHAVKLFQSPVWLQATPNFLDTPPL